MVGQAVGVTGESPWFGWAADVCHCDPFGKRGKQSPTRRGLLVGPASESVSESRIRPES